MEKLEKGSARAISPPCAPRCSFLGCLSRSPCSSSARRRAPCSGYTRTSRAPTTPSCPASARISASPRPSFFYALLIIGLLAYLAFVIVRLIRRGGRLLQLFRCVITLGMAAALFWAGLCVLWTPYYSAPSFSEQSGVDDGPVEVSELAAVTRYFAALTNEYAEDVPRTADGAGTTTGRTSSLARRRCSPARRSPSPACRASPLSPRASTFPPS